MDEKSICKNMNRSGWVRRFVTIFAGTVDKQTQNPEACL